MTIGQAVTARGSLRATEMSIVFSEISDEASAGRWGAEFSPRMRSLLTFLPTRSEAPSVRVRVSNALMNKGILTVRQLMAATTDDLLRTNNFGRRSLAALEKAMDDAMGGPGTLVEQIARWVEDDGSDAQRVALADGIRRRWK